MASMCHHEQWLCSRKRSDQCSSKLLSKHGSLSRPGYTSPARSQDCLFPEQAAHLTIYPLRQYARIVKGWVQAIGLDPPCMALYTNETYKGITDLSQDKELAAVQLLLGHTKLESTVRYLGIEVDDALEMAEQTEV